MSSSDRNTLEKSGILDQPEYNIFREWHAKKRLPLVIFFGSGLSTPAGLPNWEGLKNALHSSAKSKIDSINKIGDDLYGLASRLETARKSKDYWLSFKLYKEILTESTFVAEVRRALTPSVRATMPEGYAEILKLAPRGLITVNLDSFAANSLSSNNPSKSPLPIYGNELARKWEIIQHSDPFLVYLHGHIADSSSWVLTSDDLKNLLSSPGHKPFLEQIFLNYRVLFYGLSADDTSISSRLIDLRAAGFRTENLFWLTSRRDKEVKIWADENWIKVILYKPEPSHRAVLSALVADCNSFIAKNDDYLPIISSADIPDFVEEKAHSEIVGWEPEAIRSYLSSYLKYKLTNSDPAKHYEILDEVINRYKRAIHNSYFFDEEEGGNIWFGHKIIFPALGEGTFGHVHLATTPSEEEVAVKIMRENVHSKPEMLGGFRRGVRSMRIVSKENLPGMSKIIDAFELPPTIIMEKIGGFDLDSIIANRFVFSWTAKIKIIKQIVAIVRSAHLLAETVIHRDIKPTNIMISNFSYEPTEDPEVTVLDFDMSWHKGSEEKDVIFESRDDFAYLAPEQIDPNKIHLSTNTLVDSYGIGMTAFYLFSASHPQINSYLSKDWLRLVTQATSRGFDKNWMSAPNRMARIIYRCTQLDQKLRMDGGQISAEIEEIYKSVVNPRQITNPELIAEETMARIVGADRYTWVVEDGRGEFLTSRGLHVGVTVGLRNNEINLLFKWTNSGLVNRSSISRYLDEASKKANASINNTAWAIKDLKRADGEINFTVTATMSAISSDFRKSFEAANKVYRCFDFA